MTDQPPTTVPLHRQAGYDAVYEVIRSVPGDADRNALIWSAVEAYRTASEPEHERQLRRQVIRDLDAGRMTPEELAEGGVETSHIVDLREDGWTIRHPLTCRQDLFGCPVNRAAERDLVEPPYHPGQYVCDLDSDGHFVIGEPPTARGGS